MHDKHFDFDFDLDLLLISEDWVLLINQTHPKILSRLQMGIDAAKAAIGRGDPFVLEVSRAV